MLNLRLETDPRWVNLAEKSVEEILTDHCYCEQKAASNCISLIQSYSEKEKLVSELAPIVTEEWGHFRQVLAELQKRNLKLGKQRKDEYVNQLLEYTRKGGDRELRMLDSLLVCALIEARSCERFKLLSEKMDDEYFREFYKKFMIAEAAHYTLFLDLAKTYLPENVVKKRWDEFLEIEKKIMLSLSLRGDRMH
jgi:tRNA 2-(methylsulfanyl)-N6-isopentenyladenosine37 hydroxylase